MLQKLYARIILAFCALSSILNGEILCLFNRKQYPAFIINT
jgi:hypothetical protein